MSDWMDQLTQFLVPREPRQFLGELLRTLRTLTMATGATAAFRIDQDDLRLVHSLDLDQGTLDVSARLWREHQSQLRRGELASVPTVAGLAQALPVTSADELVGFLLVTTASVLHGEPLESAQRLVRLAGPALAAREPVDRPSPEQTISSYLGRTSPEGVMRDQMLGLLAANEWNVSRVSRLMGITRRTIYLRLKRWGVERVRVRVGSRARKARAT